MIATGRRASRRSTGPPPPQHPALGVASGSVVEGSDRPADDEPGSDIEPMLIRTQDVLEILDRVLNGLDDVGAAYLFAIDVVDAIADGTGALEEPKMLGPLSELSKVSAVNLEIVEQVRDRLSRGTDAGTA